MILSDLDGFYKSKQALAEREINTSSLSLAMVFRKKNEAAILLATKTKAEEPKIKAIAIPFHGQMYPAFYLVGSGYQPDFLELAEELRDYTQSTFSELKHPRALSDVDALELITDTVAERYSDSSKKAFGVDTLLISAIGKKFVMIRINYLGESHLCKKFAVLGGVPPTTDKETPSLRGKALEILGNAYKSQDSPNLKTARTLAEQILALEENKGEIHLETLEKIRPSSISKRKRTK